MSSPPATSRTSTTTLSRRGTSSKRGTNRPAFYLQGNHDLAKETPPSLRWTPSVTQWRTSCPNCGCDILTNSSPVAQQFGPTLRRQNATVTSTPPTTTPTVSSYRGRFKTGWTQNLRKRLVLLCCAPPLRRRSIDLLRGRYARPLLLDIVRY